MQNHTNIHADSNLINGLFLSELYDTVSLQHCLVADFTAAESEFMHGGNYDGGTLFDIDPQFVDTLNGDYHLSPCSPALNAGLNSVLTAATDLDGNPRLQQGIVDMGPYEHNYVLGVDSLSTTANCSGSNAGAVAMALSEGCPPYTYAWSNGIDTGMGTDGLTGGNYTFTITDSKGNTVTTQVVIDASNPQITLLGDSTVCYTDSTGWLEGLVDGGFSPYAYNWSIGSTEDMIANLGAGQYSLTIQDALGCVDSISTEVQGVPAPEISVNVIPASASGVADGAIQITLLSGFPPYDFQWATGDTTASVDSLFSGIYELIITDGGGCNYGYLFQVGVVMDSEEQAAISPGRLYPNPASDQVHIDWGNAEQIRILDALGRQQALLTAPTSTQINTSTWPAGMYFYVFYRDGREVGVGKLVVE